MELTKIELRGLIKHFTDLGYDGCALINGEVKLKKNGSEFKVIFGQEIKVRQVFNC